MKNKARELKKKEKEVALCLPVARAINELETADYSVPDAEWQLANCREPADITFQSDSGTQPSRMAQVVTIPYVTSTSDLELRDDNDNLRKLENGVERMLLKGGMKGWQVDIDVTRTTQLQGLRGSQLEQLAGFILKTNRGRRWSVHWQEIWRAQVGLAEFVTDISGYPLSSDSLLVHAGRGCVIPESRNFIEEAIRTKTRKYSCDTSSLMLVIGAASTILACHIENFRRDRKLSEIPFSEVWIVPASDARPTPLKRAPSLGATPIHP